MPRTSSSTTILLTAAATAAVTAVTVSGCVSVRPPTTPKAPSPTVSAHAPRPEGHADGPVVQAPAREALERMKTAPHRTPARHTEQQPQRAATPAPPRTAPRD
ncbi:hypothetical protein OKJ99_07890, partial [Streptomyces endophyticus]|nr:hypothetical protein [Streptomyces endophyticus]